MILKMLLLNSRVMPRGCAKGCRVLEMHQAQLLRHFLNVGGGRYPTHNYFWLSLNIFLYNYNYYNKKYLKKMLVLVWCWGSLYTFDSLHFVLIPVPLCCVLLRLWVVEGLPSVLYCHFDFSGSPLLVSDFVVVLMLCVVEALPSDFLRPFPFG